VKAFAWLRDRWHLHLALLNARVAAAMPAPKPPPVRPGLDVAGVNDCCCNLCVVSSVQIGRQALVEGLGPLVMRPITTPTPSGMHRQWLLLVQDELWLTVVSPALREWVDARNREQKQQLVKQLVEEQQKP